jgi:hypothetical protein
MQTALLVCRDPCGALLWFRMRLPCLCVILACCAGSTCLVGLSHLASPLGSCRCCCLWSSGCAHGHTDSVRPSGHACEILFGRENLVEPDKCLSCLSCRAGAACCYFCCWTGAGDLLAAESAMCRTPVVMDLGVSLSVCSAHPVGDG